MAINRRTLAVERELHAMLTGVTDAQTRALVTAWVNAYDSVAVELEAALLDLTTASRGGRVTRTQVIRSQRLTAARTAVAESLELVAAQSGLIITADLRQIIVQAVDAEVAMIASQLTGTRRASLRANLVRGDAAQVTAMIERSTQQITALSRPIGAEASAAIQRELLRGVAVGENPRQVARRMLRGIEDQFNGGLTRALVVARTEAMDAVRTAQMWADQANADTLTGWVWTAHFGDTRTCPACLSMHGREFPIEEPGPLGHQQCVLPGAIVTGPRALASTTRWFDGEIVELQLRGGHFLAVTPNHPILTPQGWVAAGELREGDDVVTGTGSDRPTIGRSPDDYQVPALVENVAQTLGGALAVDAVSVPTAAEDFHGDGTGSDVHVVRTNRLLRHDLGATLTQVSSQCELMVGDVRLEALAGRGRLALLLERLRNATASLLRGKHDPPVLLGGSGGGHGAVGLYLSPERHTCGFESVLDGSAGAFVGLRQRVDRLTGHVTGDDILGGQRALREKAGTRVGGAKRLLSGTVTPQATLAEDRSEPFLAYPMPSRDDLAAFAGDVVTHSLLNTRRRRWSGHVYNLQTETGWYLANGILTHNCRCARVPRTKSWADLGFEGIPDPPDTTPDAEAWFNNLTTTQQTEILGPKRFEAWSRGDYPMSDWARRRSNAGWRDSYVVSPPPA